MNNNNILLYHAGCPDGFGAAWAFWNKFKDTMEYVAVTHGKQPPDVKGKNVYIADFCYKREQLLALKEDAESLIVLDHHKSAQEDCGDLSFCHFDMNHSGAFLAWEYLYSEDNVPLLLRYIEDRDLWKWELDNTEEILSAVDSFEKTFENWNLLNTYLDEVGSDRWSKVKVMGEGILQYKNNLIASLMKNQHELNILGDTVPAVNIAFFQSEIASELAKSAKYAAAYYFDGESYRFSLRSAPDGSDVSLVAANFGGGGHKNASGFRVKSLTELNKGA